MGYHSFSYLFKSIHYKRFTKFLYFILLVWLSFSIFELYIINQYPILHLNTFEGIGVQNIFSMQDYYHGFGVHGLGITSQVNTSALILFIFFSVYYFLQRKSIIIKFFHLISLCHILASRYFRLIYLSLHDVFFEVIHFDLESYFEFSIIQFLGSIYKNNLIIFIYYNFNLYKLN